jgi:PAS domain S-box-containing protein
MTKPRTEVGPRRDTAFRGFFENLAVGGVQIGTDGRFLQVNERFSTLTGYGHAELLGMRVGDLDHPDDRPLDEQRWAAFLSDPDIGYDVQKRYVRRDGGVIWVHATAARIGTGEDGVLIAKTVEDVTDRVVADTAFRGFFENLPVGGVQIGTDGRFLQVNDRFTSLTGYSREDLLGMRVGDLDHPEDRALDQERWAAFLNDEDVGYDVEKRYVQRDGRVIWVHVTAARISTGTDRVLIAKTVEDISERVAAVTALYEREESLVEALAAREEFLGLVSHELRTPLTVVVGLANVMARGGMSREQMLSSAVEIRESAEHLASLLESMLVLARANADDAPPFEPIQLERVVARAVARHHQVFPRRTISLDARIADSLVDGNEAWVSQVVSNMLGNAEKYSPPEARIAVSLDRTDAEIFVRVLDEGSGIDAADLPMVFEPFYRAPRAQKESGGLGLGLAVCKRLIELQGGSVWARTRDVGGAEFGFSLPALAEEHDDGHVARPRHEEEPGTAAAG